MQLAHIPLDSLLLDPNNYRLLEIDDFVEYPDDRFNLDRVQDATRRRLKGENLEPLKHSILSNGLLEIERIVVAPYRHDPEKYLVIEGNRRVAVLLSIRDDHDAGILVSEKLVEVFKNVPCLVAGGEGQEAFFREAIMGIRHVGGIKEWGGYQRAKLVADMKDNHGLDASVISDRIGLSAIEVNRRYRAFKALQQMQGSADYADNARPSLYPLFHEAISIPAVREWLGWNQDKNIFDDIENTERFYQLISPRSLDDGEARPAKVRTYSDVRSLREVITNQEALADLLQPERELVDALTIANRNRIVGRWKNEVAEAQTALLSIPAVEVADFDDKDIAVISRLVAVANQVLAIRNAVAPKP